MKLKMSIDEALAFADEWSRGMTIHDDSQGWRVVCMLLAEEVRMLRQKVNSHSRLLETSMKTREQTQNEIAEWISTQRNDIPATGEEFAAAIRMRLNV